MSMTAWVWFMYVRTPPPLFARATLLSEQQYVLFPQLLEPCPIFSFIHTPLVRATAGAVSVNFWDFGVTLARMRGLG